MSRRVFACLEKTKSLRTVPTICYPISNMRQRTNLDDIGRLLKAYRLERGHTADEMAARLGISRAAVYRIEGGEVIKIETLEKLAQELQTSLAGLQGVSLEYYPAVIDYFDRMRQLEENSEQVVAHFPPISYLLTTDDYPVHLKKTLIESLPSNGADNGEAAREIDAVIAILDEGKKSRAQLFIHADAS
jgi:transcriptional regulator with XRE-family HTH domain